MTDIALRYLLFGEDKSASKVASTVGSAFTKLGDKIGGEVGDLLSKVGEGIDSISEHSKSVGKAMTAVGGVIAGVGVALQAVGSKDKAAMNALNVAIKDTGHSAKDYADQIEAAVKSNENYGISAADTKLALARLTTATGDPAKALANMGVVADLAAAQNISLATAAAKVAAVLNGNGSKTLKQYGINLVSVKTTASHLTTAEKAHDKAIQDVAAAQKRLNNLTIIDKDKKKLSTSQTIALHDASDNLKTAQDRLKTATDNLAKAMSANKDAIKQNDDAITKLGDKVKGRAAAQVDTFTGRINVAKTKVADWVGEMGNRFGPVITYAGGTLAALGTIYEAKIIPAIGNAIKTAALWIASQVRTAVVATVTIARMVAQAAATAAVTVATTAWTAVQWALNAALTANPIGLIIVGIAALVAGTILAYKHSTVFRNIVTGAFHAVLAAGQVLWGWFKAAAKFLGHVFVGIGKAIAKPFTDAFKVIMAGIHAVETAFDKVKAALGSGPSVKPHTQPGAPSNARARASGGPVHRGQPYIVGENGPELFVPGQSGGIIPNGGGSKSAANGSGDFTATAPLILQIDSTKVWQGMVTMKRRRGNISLGLA